MRKKQLCILIIFLVINLFIITKIYSNISVKQILKINNKIEMYTSDGETIVQSWNLDSNITATLYENGKLIISGSGMMKNWESDTYTGDWHNEETAKLVREVIIEDGITEIGKRAFANCENLTTVKIPNSVTRIGAPAFEIIVRPSDDNDDTNETQKEINNAEHTVFENCKSLANIIVASDNTKYSSVNGVLFNKNQTEIKYYPEGITSNSYTIPNTVLNIRQNAFKNAMHLINVEIPNSMTNLSLSWKLEGCANLQNINVSSDNPIYSSEDGILFNKYKNELLYYPEGKNEKNYIIPNGVYKIGSFAFNNNRYLTNVQISDDVTTIGDEAFAKCIGLTSVDIPKNVYSIGWLPFLCCKNLKEINISEENNTYSSENGIIFDKNKEKLVYYPEGKEDSIYRIPNSVTKMESNGAFVNCTNLKKLIIPNDIEDPESLGLTIEKKTGYIIGAEREYLDIEIICKKGSKIEQYAIEKGFKYSYINENTINFIKLKELDINGVKCLVNLDIKNNTVEDIISNESNALGNNYTLKFYKGDSEITGNEKVGTGTKIKLMINNDVKEEYTAILYGDTTGNGNPRSIDALTIIKNKLGIVKLKDEILTEAGRITQNTRNSSEIPSAVDALAIIKYKLGLRAIEQQYKLSIDSIKYDVYNNYCNMYAGVNGITIINGVENSEDYGKIISRFSEITESFVNNWDMYLKNETEKCIQHYNYIMNLGNAVNIPLKYNNYNDLTTLWTEIYDLEKTSGNMEINYGASWLADRQKTYNRINTEFYGEPFTSVVGTHYGKYKNIGLLAMLGSNEFKRIELIIDEEHNTKEIIYVMINDSDENNIA